MTSTKIDTVDMHAKTTRFALPGVLTQEPVNVGQGSKAGGDNGRTPITAIVYDVYFADVPTRRTSHECARRHPQAALRLGRC